MVKMGNEKDDPASFEVNPLTTERWADFETVFGEHGAGGCWCMWYRLQKKQFDAQAGDGNRDAMKSLTASGVVPGLIGYLNGQPAGWISVAPREDFPRLRRSRVMKAVDDQSVWSVVCFFIDRKFRKQGLSLKLLKAGVEYALAHGARIVEGYPIDLHDRSYPDAFAFHGMQSVFEQAGFREVARRSPTRPVMRYMVDA
jgi:GNAT superfamily N-acetyltransferase